MVLFLFALVVTAFGVGLFALSHPDVHDITVRTYHLAGVPDWQAAGALAAIPLFLFFVHALVAGIRLRLLRRTNERLSAELSNVDRYPIDSYGVDPYATGSYDTDTERAVWLRPQPAPKRSWTTGE